MLELLIGKSLGWIIGAGFIFVAFVVTFMKGRLEGRKLERQKNEALVRRALEQRVKMNAEAGDIATRVKNMSDAELAAEVERWSTKSG